jgi:prepilin-type N-terminal cleavage/methylation domain-containing protein
MKPSNDPIPRFGKRRALQPAVTLLELLAVVLIIGILSTIATNTYIGQVRRARVAATADLIRELSIAIARYEVDTGAIPPGGSATLTFGTGRHFLHRLPHTHRRRQRRHGDLPGSSLLHLALVHSVSGNATSPSLPTWRGPYIEFQGSQISLDTSTNQTQILDAFGQPIHYLTAADYTTSPFQGTEMFDGTEPTAVSDNADPDLPSPNPFAGTEVFYNVTTFQIFSLGPNGATFGTAGSPAPTSTNLIYAGTEADDVNNFGYLSRTAGPAAARLLPHPAFSVCVRASPWWTIGRCPSIFPKQSSSSRSSSPGKSPSLSAPRSFLPGARTSGNLR